MAHDSRRPSCRVAVCVVLLGFITESCLGQQSNSDSRDLEQLISLNRELARASPGAVEAVVAKRAALLAGLIESNPSRAIALAMPVDRAAQLAAAMPSSAGQIERHIEWEGPVGVFVEDNFTVGGSRTRTWIEVSGSAVEVHFSDTSPPLTSGQVVKLRGIRLGNRMAAELAIAAPAAAGTAPCTAIVEQRVPSC